MVAGLHEADGRRHNQLAPARLLVAGRERALAQQIQLVLVEAALEPEPQAVVAVSWRIDGLLIDPNGIDPAALLDELLPIPAVASEARDLAGANRTNLTEANLRYHSLETGALYAAGGRTTKIIIDHFTPGPPERRQPVPHGVLQRTALAIVQHLMCRGLTHVKNRLALQMMRPDLVRDHDRPPSRAALLSSQHDRGSTASSGS